MSSAVHGNNSGGTVAILRCAVTHAQEIFAPFGREVMKADPHATTLFVLDGPRAVQVAWVGAVREVLVRHRDRPVVRH